MGNLCSKRPSAADNDPFAQPGRVLGSAPPKPSEPRAQIPKTTSQGQRLGSGGGSNIGGRDSGGGGGGGDARTAAAKAAEERLAKSQRQPSGKLGRDLASQKAMTRNDTLNNLSQDERRMRDVDSNAQAQAYN